MNWSVILKLAHKQLESRLLKVIFNRKWKLRARYLHWTYISKNFHYTFDIGTNFAFLFVRPHSRSRKIHGCWGILLILRTFLVAQRLKRLPPMQETRVWSLGREDPLETELVTHPSILAWRIPWMEKSGRLQSTGSQRVGHDWATSLHFMWHSNRNIM